MGYARFYQQVFELLPHERPADELIDEDHELDEWWQRFIDERARSVAKAYGVKHATTRDAEMQMAQVPQFSA